MKNKIKTYCFSCLILALILTLLRCISLTAFYDTHTGYFNSSFIPTVMNIIYTLGAAWCLSALVLIPKSQIETKFTPNSVCIKGASAFASAMFIFSILYMSVSQATSKFSFAIILTTAISAPFFIFSVAKREIYEKIRAFTSISLIAAFTVILATLYFDMTIAMNSPHKIHGSFVLMSAMIFGLCETRTYLGNPIPRVHLASALSTFTLGISFAISTVVYILAASPSRFVANPVILGNLGYIAIIMGISVYAIARCFTFENTNTDNAEEDNGL